MFFCHCTVPAHNCRRWVFWVLNGLPVYNLKVHDLATCTPPPPALSRVPTPSLWSIGPERLRTWWPRRILRFCLCQDRMHPASTPFLLRWLRPILGETKMKPRFIQHPNPNTKNGTTMLYFLFRAPKSPVSRWKNWSKSFTSTKSIMCSPNSTVGTHLKRQTHSDGKPLFPSNTFTMTGLRSPRLILWHSLGFQKRQFPSIANVHWRNEKRLGGYYAFMGWHGWSAPVYYAAIHRALFG
jgi:hypothetical protein